MSAGSYVNDVWPGFLNALHLKINRMKLGSLKKWI